MLLSARRARAFFFRHCFHAMPPLIADADAIDTLIADA